MTNLLILTSSLKSFILITLIPKRWKPLLETKYYIISLKTSKDKEEESYAFPTLRVTTLAKTGVLLVGIDMGRPGDIACPCFKTIVNNTYLNFFKSSKWFFCFLHTKHFNQNLFNKENKLK